MSDRTFGHKKVATSTFSNPSLVSPTTPTLANPVRGFGLTTNNVIQTATGSVNQQAAQSGGHNISFIALHRPQAKLTVGAPNDMYEQEADRIADRVMSMPDGKGSVQRETMPEEEEEIQTKTLGNSIQREVMPEEEEEIQTKTLAATITPLVQREVMPKEEEEIQTKTLDDSIQCETMPEEEEEIQTKPLSNRTLQREVMPEEEEEIQTKSSPDAGFQAESNLENRLSSSQGGGSALPDEVRSFMEPRFGADFSQVRVHTGGEAVQMNRELNAQAFTHKQDVYFGVGKAPGKDALTAHELTHVVQQTGAVQRQPTNSPAPAAGVSPPSPEPPGGPPPPVAKLKLHADTETVNRSDLTWKELNDAQVGHSWVSLEYTDKTKIPSSIGEPTKGLLKSGSTAFGFWPLINRASNFTQQEQERIDRGQTPGAGASTNSAHRGFSLNPFKDVPGRVEEPDTAHTPKGTKEYDLTQAEVGSLLRYVNSMRSANYNLYSFNCTTFAVQSVLNAGQVAPSGSSWGICLPNALYKDLYQMKKGGNKSVTVAPLEPGERHE